jgi:adenine phosphoribosyltransferase
MTRAAELALRRLRQAIRDIPDFPVAGVVFKDITPVLADATLFAYTIDRLTDSAAEAAPDAIVAIESRGFILGAPIALQLGCGFVPVRKPGKLPFRTVREDYELEYGTGALEAHEDALVAGRGVVVVDDVLATGGTAAATRRLIERLGATVLSFAFLLELDFLHGRDRLTPAPVHSLLRFEA